MKEITIKTDAQKRQEDLQRLAGFRIIDDTFARSVFKGKPDLAEFVLRIITKLDDLTIDPLTYDTQYDAKRLAGSRSLLLDVHGGDTKGRKYDLELEKWDASPERAEYHMGTMLVEHLHSGDDFSDLPETYVIFACDRDVIGNGRAVNKFSYRNDDFVVGDEESEKKIERGASMKGRTHIIFVNGEYRDTESDIGKLIHDLKCNEYKDMLFTNLAERVKYLKEDPKGVEEMCKVMEEMKVESEQVRTLQLLMNLMDSMQLGVEKAMDALKIDPSERSLYAASVKAAHDRVAVN